MDLIEFFPRNSIFDNFFFVEPKKSHLSIKKRSLWNPKTDIYDDANGTLTIIIELPGISKSDVQIESQDRILIVTGEKRERLLYTEGDDTTSVVSSGDESSEKKKQTEPGNDSTPVVGEDKDKKLVHVKKDRKRKLEQGRFIQREITHGKFKQIISLQKKHDVDNMKAKLSDGLLQIVVPVVKQEEAKKSHRIDIH